MTRRNRHGNHYIVSDSTLFGTLVSLLIPQRSKPNAEKTTPGRGGGRKRQEKAALPDDQFGRIIEITFDQNHHPKALIVEAPYEGGYIRFKYIRTQIYYSNANQVNSYYMNCCTDKSLNCPARIVVSEIYNEERLAWIDNPELRKPQPTEEYQILKVRELHSAPCFEGALKIAEKDSD